MSDIANKPVLLCIDDEQSVLNSLIIQLRENLGDQYLYEAAMSADEALEVIDDLKNDNNEILVIISDYIMPGMKGDELLIKINSKYPDIIKIMLTGQATIEGVVNAINNAKIYRYIGKPWEKNDLVMTIQEAIKSYKQTNYIKKLLNTYNKFVPKEFLAQLNKKDIIDIKLGDQIEKEMTVMFSDIRDFTSLSEKMSPEDNFNFINSYLKKMVPIIRKNNGFIDKFIGDAIMALFTDVEGAINASIEMQIELNNYNCRRIDKGYKPINVGIGMNTGSVMLGTIGEDERMETTVISDTVNQAARMESLTKVYEAKILLSIETLNSIIKSKKYSYRLIDIINLKGKSAPSFVIELLDCFSDEEKNLKIKTKDQFEKAIWLFREEKIKESYEILNEISQINKNDVAVNIYLKKCDDLLKESNLERN
ncbi:MAG TPA: adenylate/guanylate cyclase domain-containing protein [Spirochaetota bacterium]|nr:adenylate/guanylate cyclase domain-containing protein [Spirochaetota bacterium]